MEDLQDVVVLELEGADGVRDVLDGVRLAVREVVDRVHLEARFHRVRFTEGWVRKTLVRRNSWQELFVHFIPIPDRHRTLKLLLNMPRLSSK